MRGEADEQLIRKVISELGQSATGPGTVYLVGGCSVVLEGLRQSTIDVDLKLDPEPAGIFEAIARVKDRFQVNVELAAPDQFIPELPGWKERSPLIDRVGRVSFRHYDFYSQALAKIERGHRRDRDDVREMLEHGLIERHELMRLFEAIEDKLLRYPAINPAQFKQAVETFVKA